MTKMRYSKPVVSILIGVALATPAAFAQRNKKKTTVSQSSQRSAQAGRKKTVGELLSQATQASRGGALGSSQKGAIALPSANLGFQQQIRQVNLESVKPPRSSEIM